MRTVNELTPTIQATSLPPQLIESNTDWEKKGGATEVKRKELNIIAPSERGAIVTERSEWNGIFSDELNDCTDWLSEGEYYCRWATIIKILFLDLNY